MREGSKKQNSPNEGDRDIVLCQLVVPFPTRGVGYSSPISWALSPQPPLLFDFELFPYCWHMTFAFFLDFSYSHSHVEPTPGQKCCTSSNYAMKEHWESTWCPRQHYSKTKGQRRRALLCLDGLQPSHQHPLPRVVSKAELSTKTPPHCHQETRLFE